MKAPTESITVNTRRRRSIDSTDSTDSIDSSAVERLLILHFGQLGDSVLSLPAVEALRDHFDHARVIVLASSSAAQIFRLAGFPEVWPVDRVRWKHAPARALVEIPLLVARLYRERFDLAVDFHTFSETSLLAWAAGIPQRVAMLRPTRGIARLITHKPPMDDPDGVLLDRYCTVLAPLGIEVHDRHPRLTPPPDAITTAQQRLAALEPEWHACEWLGICPGAGHPSRRWPATRFVEVVRALRQQAGPRFRALVFAGPEEAEAVLAPFTQVPEVRIIRGLNVPQLAAALARCRLLVTNATGPSHIAAAVGTPVVTIGEIPAFDPVGPTPASVRAIRAARVVADIAAPEVIAATLEMWTAGRR